MSKFCFSTERTSKMVILLSRSRQMEMDKIYCPIHFMSPLFVQSESAYPKSSISVLAEHFICKKSKHYVSSNGFKNQTKTTTKNHHALWKRLRKTNFKHIFDFHFQPSLQFLYLSTFSCSIPNCKKWPKNQCRLVSERLYYTHDCQ